MKDDYVQVKIHFCRTAPFCGLNYLGMWYGRVVAREIAKWEAASRQAALQAAAQLKVSLCKNRGWHLRKILTDRLHFKVYEWESQQLMDDSLLPVSLLGENMEILDPSDVPSVLLKRGGLHCEFSVNGLAYRGYVLPGKSYSAAWTESGRPMHFENENAKNPNARILRPLGCP